MNEATIEIPELGNVTIRQSTRARRISIRLQPFKGVTLVVPPGNDVREGINFLKEKKEWIQKNLKKLEEKEERLTIFDENTKFRSRSFALSISKHKDSRVRLHLHQGILHIHYPDNMQVTHPGIQEHIRYGIEEALRMEARRFLPMRLNELAKQYSILYNNVTIKNLKSRWGSCSARNNINLNLHLMRLPDELIDYVLLHELCHVHEKNHGPGFWHRLDRMTNGRARELDHKMKDYQTKIY